MSEKISQNELLSLTTEIVEDGLGLEPVVRTLAPVLGQGLHRQIVAAKLREPRTRSSERH